MDILGVLQNFNIWLCGILLHLVRCSIRQNDIAILIFHRLSMLIGHGKIFLCHRICLLSCNIPNILLFSLHGWGLNLNLLTFREVVAHLCLNTVILITQPLEVKSTFLNSNRLSITSLCADCNFGIGCHHTVINRCCHFTLICISNTRAHEHNLIFHHKPRLIAGCILVCDKILRQLSGFLGSITILITKLHACHAHTRVLECDASRKCIGSNREIDIIILLYTACSIFGIELASIIQLHNGLARLLWNGCPRKPVWVNC